MDIINALRLALILQAIASSCGLKCFFCKYEYVSGVVDDEDNVTKPIPYCGKDPYEKPSSHIVDCDIYYDSNSRVNPDFRTAVKRIANIEKRPRLETKSGITGDSDWWGGHLPWSTRKIHARVRPYICMTVKTNESQYPGRSCGFNILLDCRQLAQITEGGIGPKSFLQECHQCTTDLCNVGIKGYDWKWSLMVWMWLCVIGMDS